MKNLLILPLFLLVACSGSAVRRGNPALELWRHYEPGKASGYATNPYLNNILSISLLDDNSHAGEIGAYIQWYCDRLNYPDKHGVTGSMYDYYISGDGRETAGRSYDSVDSYAATFLIMAERYYSVTGDAALLKKNWTKIKDVAFIISFLQDKDGLVKALPSSDNKYLMDNCECYGGLLAYQKLSETLGYGREPYYDTVAAAIKSGIMANLRDPGGKFFYWGISGGVRSAYNPEILYPDALSQLFPVLYGVSADGGVLDGFLKDYGGRTAGFPLEQRLIVEMTRQKVSGCPTGSGVSCIRN